jgi:hypothetical protein
MNDDTFNHDDLPPDQASTPNAAELNAALPLFSASSSTYDTFDDLAGLDINQTNFSELDEEEQDIAHIILSDPSLLGLDCLVGAGPPKRRVGMHGMSGAPTPYTTPVQQQPVASTASSRQSSIFDVGSSRMTYGNSTPVQTGNATSYAHRVLSSSVAGDRAGQGVSENSKRGFEAQGSRASSPPKAYVR